MPAVASGGSTVPSTLCKISKARGSGLVIWTGMGLVGFLSSRLGAGAALGAGGAEDWLSSSSMPLSAPAAFSSVVDDAADLRKVAIFSASTC